MTARRKTEAPLIQIGATYDAVVAARKAIMDILVLRDMGERTKRKALDVLSKLCGVGPTSISNCNFSRGNADEKEGG